MCHPCKAPNLGTHLRSMHPKPVAEPHLAAWLQPGQQRLHDEHRPESIDLKLPHDDVSCCCLQRVDLLDAGRHHQQVDCRVPDRVLQLRRVALCNVIPCNRTSTRLSGCEKGFQLNTISDVCMMLRWIWWSRHRSTSAASASPVMHWTPAASSWLLGVRTVPMTVYPSSFSLLHSCSIRATTSVSK